MASDDVTQETKSPAQAYMSIKTSRGVTQEPPIIQLEQGDREEIIREVDIVPQEPISTAGEEVMHEEQGDREEIT